MKSRGNEIKWSGNGHALGPMLNEKEMANKKNNVMNEIIQRTMEEQKEDVLILVYSHVALIAYFSFPNKNI